MNEQIYGILILILSGIIIPAIPVLIVTVYTSNRNSKHIGTLYERIDELKERKADEKDLKIMEMKFHDFEIKTSELHGRFSAGLDRLESIERKFEEKLKRR